MCIGTDSPCLQFGAQLGQALWVLMVDEGNQPLTHMTASVPIARRIQRAEQVTQLHGFFAGFGHLQYAHAPVPQVWDLRANAFDLVAQYIQGQRIINSKKDRAYEAG